MTRRRFLKLGVAGVGTLVAAGVGVEQLVQHGILPGKHALQVLEGDCSVTHPPLDFLQLGPSYTNHFYSHARRRLVGYTIAYPPGHRPGAALPLVVMLHGFGGDHAHALSGMSPAQAVALRVDGTPLQPFAMVTVDGGDLYWNRHPGDDPVAMVVEELIPLCRRHGLGVPPQRIGTMGISMGGYGALLFAERYPHLFRAVAAISPAIWTSYAQARGANAGAYASAVDFASADVVTHSAPSRAFRCESHRASRIPSIPAWWRLPTRCRPAPWSRSPRGATQGTSSWRKSHRRSRFSPVI